jgi:hypothetical protein
MDISQIRRSYDTELLIFRTLFALDPDTNLPISTNFVLTTDGIGGLVWLDPFTNLSTAGPGVGYLPSTLWNLTSNVSSLSSLVSSLQIGLSTVSTALGNAFLNTGVYVNDLVSTIDGLATFGYISTSQLQSTVEGLGSAEYVSTLSLRSTVEWFIDPSRYVSTGALVSATAAFLPAQTLLSTVVGLGTSGYISSATFSTFLTSTLLSSLTSTVEGLGSAGYISTTQLQSTVEGLATAGYISTTQLQSTVEGLATTGYISTTQLQSTVEGLATEGYISTTQLISTVDWLLDPSRYISTGSLVSTVIGISTNLQTVFFVDLAGSLIINGGTTIISSAQEVIFLSTFLFSSITYQGVNGTTTGVIYPDATFGRNMFFSSATVALDAFSSYIVQNSRVSLDIYPTFVFSQLNTGVSGFVPIPMSSFLAYDTTYLSSAQSESWVIAQNKTAGFGNLYQQPIRMEVPGSLLINNYDHPYVLCHNLMNSITSNLDPGFVNNNITVQYPSTNSLFLSIQNLP